MFSTNREKGAHVPSSLLLSSLEVVSASLDEVERVKLSIFSSKFDMVNRKQLTFWVLNKNV
jgi:hypothetical protein